MTSSNVLRPLKRRGATDQSVTIGTSGMYLPASMVADWPSHRRVRLDWDPTKRRLSLIEDPGGYRFIQENGLSVKIHAPRVMRWIRDQGLPFGIHTARRHGTRIDVQVGDA